VSGEFTIPPGDKLKSNNILLNLGSPSDVITRNNSVDYKACVADWWINMEIAIKQINPKKVIQISTIHIIDHSDAGVIQDPYYLSHIACLRMLEEYCAKNSLNIQVIYVGNVFGSLDKSLIPRENLILNKAIISLLRNEKLSLRTMGDGVRNFQWIGDVVDFVLEAVIKPSANNRTRLNASELMSVKDALKQLHKSIGSALEFDEWCHFGLGSDNQEGVIRSQMDYHNLKTSFNQACEEQAKIFQNFIPENAWKMK
jgi:nucleoside-diphosphate-sugar epimerase